MTTQELKKVLVKLNEFWLHIKAVLLYIPFKVKYVEAEERYYLVKRTWVWLLFMPIAFVLFILFVSVAVTVATVQEFTSKGYLFTDISKDGATRMDKSFFDKYTHMSKTKMHLCRMIVLFNRQMN